MLLSYKRILCGKHMNLYKQGFVYRELDCQHRVCTVECEVWTPKFKVDSLCSSKREIYRRRPVP